MMRPLFFDNRFIRELPGDPITENYTRQVSNSLWSAVQPTPVKQPKLLAYSPEVADMLGLTAADMQDPELIQTLGGNGALQGMFTYATRYGGHQFGHWAGQLGDGRAIYLGELVHQQKRFELQLKGAGETPYSRSADGRAVLRSSLREFLCSEAMHYLGIPTTRALSLVTTGDPVVRDMFYDGNPQFEPGAIVCRVAPSFIRFGHFEILASRDELPLLKRFIGFTIDRDFADWWPTTGLLLDVDNPGQAMIEAWFDEICTRTAIMIAHWMRVGFVHGVMNTDNMSILGLTIDYGPYGWIDNFDPSWTPNTTDAQGRRYCYGRQPDIARWNLERLAEALATILPETNELSEGLSQFDRIYMRELTGALANKFGLEGWQAGDGDLINDVFELMQRAEVDQTLFFTHLKQLDISKPQLATLQEAFYTTHGYEKFGQDIQAWLNKYSQRAQQSALAPGQRQQRMASSNPIYVLRNYLAQEAIDLAAQGDNSRLLTLLEVLRNPYTEQVGMAEFTKKRPDWARHKAGCSMLSCSS
jgi:serine/tyrosine/threonine adenylyltransferase